MGRWSDSGTVALYGASTALFEYRQSLIDAWLAGRSPRTRGAYADDAKRFATWLEAPTSDAAARHLLSLPLGQANGLVLAWRNQLRDEGRLAPATINRRLAAIKSLVKLGRTLGLVAWTLEVPNLKSQSYRDTRGPGAAGARDMLTATPGLEEAAIRDRALIRVLYDLALRRDEAISRDWTDYDPAQRRLTIRGKGRLENETLDVPASTCAALNELRLVRGMPTRGSVFVSVDPVHRGHRLTGEAVRQIILAAGKRAGIDRVRPHGLRHAAITAVLDANGGNTRAAQRFSRHKDVKTLGTYDDNREAVQGAMADLIALEYVGAPTKVDSAANAPSLRMSDPIV
jgi:integrase/recombinase XerC